MNPNHSRPLEFTDEDAALRLIVEGTATETGDRFFEALAKNLAIALHTRNAWVSEYIAETRRLRALALWSDGQLVTPFDIPIDGTPCKKVIESASLVHYPRNIVNVFPDNPGLKAFKAVSYMGMPLIDSSGNTIGNLAVLDTRPMPKADRALAIFKIFAARASAELRRILSEAEIRRSEEKYRRIVETTGEGFLLLDGNLRITDVNDAFVRLIGYTRRDVIGRTLLDFAPNGFRQFLQENRTGLFEGQLSEFEGEIISRKGRRIPVYIYGNTLRGDHDEMLGYMNFVVDMTRHKRSLMLAGEVQTMLLPQTAPQIKDFDIAGRTISCDEVGGDYFDFLQMPDCSDDALNIVVGDVSGHGADAALIMTSARALLRMRAAQCGTPTQILNEMNLHFSRDLQPTGIFMTLFFMRILPQTGTLQWIRAGHLPAAVYNPADDSFSELMGRGMALGVDPHFSFQEYNTPLIPGQIIAVGTDGITETKDPQGAFYGQERLQATIRSHAAETADAIIAAVLDDLGRFAAGRKLEDDVTLLILKVEDTFRRGPGLADLRNGSLLQA
ncbi:MAG: SpoIIE family protein phosphatase [Desulfosarcina sp.]|nr:SpoIIE family protein phosphatase [Desulfobacterales bacterium]